MIEKSRRKSPRFEINKKVIVKGGNYTTKHLMTENCSDGGIFVIDDVLAEMQVGSDIQIQNDNGDESGNSEPTINARIAWTNSQGAGIEYLPEP